MLKVKYKHNRLRPIGGVIASVPGLPRKRLYYALIVGGRRTLGAQTSREIDVRSPDPMS